MLNKTRVLYAGFFGILLLAEVCIALFVHDGFVRPYLGDVLVTVLICCLIRMIVPNRFPALPLYVFIFAALVEVAQYFEIVKILGLDNNRLIRTIVGTTFSVMDLICYGVGVLLFQITEKAVRTLLRCRHHTDSQQGS